ncbi:MAG: B12-binding domain-containing radical SAM protein [Thermodesulfobacteriota bacterium]
MARIAFIQDIWHEYIGIMSISAYLKKKGHGCDVFITDGEKDLRASLEDFNPDIIAFSCLTGGHTRALEQAGALRDHFELPVIFGGIHTTLFPQIIDHPQVDMICIGEGEETITEVLDNLDSHQKLHSIKGIWIKDGDKIYRNDVRPLIEDLSSIPVPDRGLYLKYPLMRDNPLKHFMAGRGCPYNCTYCYNDSIKKVYQSKKFVRVREKGHVLRGIRYAKENSRLETVVFDDDTFTGFRPWLKGFLKDYKHEIGLPYICNLRVENVDEKLAEMLAESGCFRVCMGIECGNETLRNKILKKNFSNLQVIRAAEMLKSHGIKILTNNMMGIPDETLKDTLETIKLNIEIKTDYPWCSIFQPYPETPLAEYAIEKGYLDTINIDNFYPTFFEGSLLKTDDIDSIVNVQKLFYIAIRFPWTFPLIKRLVRLPLGRIYHIIFLLSFAYRYARSNRLGLRDIFRFSVSSLRLYRQRSS